MKWTMTTLGLISALAIIAAAPAAAGDRSASDNLIDREEDCLEAVPESASVSGITDNGKPLSLDVLVLLDRVSLERGREVMAKSQEAYDPLDISLDVRFESVKFLPEEVNDEVPASTADRVIEEAERWTMGTRPADADVVYVITDQILSDAAGKADCIGGVRWADGAYAVGENYRAEDLLGVFYKHATAKIAAHEIGHLMGAHHHYTNCAEGAPGAIAEVGPTPCTNMFPSLDEASLIFGTLEAAVIRGHTLDFASAGADINPVHSSAVTLTRRNSKVQGRVTSTNASCHKGVTVQVQSYSMKKGWTKEAETKTTKRGTYKLSAPASQKQQRAFVPQSSFEVGREKHVCAQAASAPL